MKTAIAWTLPLAALAPAMPAAAKPGGSLGPTSSASATITVSVAPRIGLASAEGACLASNGQVPQTIVLVTADGSRPIDRCERPPAAYRGKGLVIVRAE